jgi:hypothetical protein
MLHACIAQSVARAVCSSAGVSYAVVARDLDSIFARAVLVIRSKVGRLHTLCLNTRSHRSDLSQRYREIKNIR